MKKWICTVCGHIHEGSQPPDVCPNCGAKAEDFVELD
jgi:rubrerythrin